MKNGGQREGIGLIARHSMAPSSGTCGGGGMWAQQAVRVLIVECHSVQCLWAKWKQCGSVQ